MEQTSALKGAGAAQQFTGPEPLRANDAAELNAEHRAKLRTSALVDGHIDQLARQGWQSLPNGRLEIPYLRPDGTPEEGHDGSPWRRWRLGDAEVAAAAAKGEKVGRYRSPSGNGCRLYHPALRGEDYQKRLSSRHVPLRITEGELKGEAGTVHDPSRVTVAIGGVSSWRDRYDGADQSLPLVDFDEIPVDGREVRLCFDSDLRKPAVAAELRRLAELLAERGAHVLIEVLPHGLDGERLGIDDLIHRHGAEAFRRITAVARSPFKVRRQGGRDILVWAFDPEPTNTHQRLAYAYGLLGADWRRSADARDAWQHWTGTHWADVVGDDPVAAALEVFAQCQGWQSLELGAMRSLIAAFRRSIQPPAEHCIAGLVPFRNGCLDLASGNHIPHHRSHGNRWVLPYDHNPLAACPKVQAFLSQTVTDHDAIAIVRAYGRGLLTGQRTKAFLEITGPGDSGKSVLANLMVALVGYSNTAGCTLQRIEDRMQRFETIKLRDRRLALFSECQDYSGPMAVIKALTGGDQVGAEIKGGRHLDFTYNGGVILVGNAPVRPSDPSGAVINRRRSILVPNVVSPADQRPMLDADGSGGWQGELAGELSGWANWCLSMPAEEARAALARDVRSLSRAEAEIGILLGTEYLAEWAESHLVWTGDDKSFVRVGDAAKPEPGSEGSGADGLYSSYRRFMEGQGNTRPLALRTFKAKLVDLLRDTLGLPMPQGCISARGPYQLRGIGSVVPCVRLRTDGDDDDQVGVVRHGYRARASAADPEPELRNGWNGSGTDREWQEPSQGTDGMDGMDVASPALSQKNPSDGFFTCREGSPESVPAVPSVPSKGSHHSRSIPHPFPSVPDPFPTAPPMPQVHPEYRLEVPTWVSAARDALADAGLPHDPRHCWECLTAWQSQPDGPPAISQRQVASACSRLPALSPTPVIPGLE